MKTLRIKYFIFFIVTAFVTYLLTSLGFFLYYVISSYLSIQIPLDKYAQVHKTELKDKIFNQLFIDAKNCTNLNSVNKQQCQQRITHRMAIIIKEEELLSNKYDWPNDLSLVKQNNNTFYRLGWNGELIDISSGINKQIINSPYIMKFFTRQCRNFTIRDGNTASCEIYATIPLENNEVGYLVRTVGLYEEEDITLWLIFVPFMGAVGISHILTGNFNDMYFVLEGIIGITTPFLLASFATIAYAKKDKSNKKISSKPKKRINKNS